MVLINFFYEKKGSLPFDKDCVRLWLKGVVKKENKTLGCVNFIYCTDDYLLDLNKTYLKHTSLTDVITFNFSENKKTIEGDVYISTERVKENAKAFSETFSLELLRTMVHGVLHLIGYNDKITEDKKLMVEKENHFLSDFKLNKKFHVEQKKDVREI